MEVRGEEVEMGEGRKGVPLKGTLTAVVQSLIQTRTLTRNQMYRRNQRPGNVGTSVTNGCVVRPVRASERQCHQMMMILQQQGNPMEKWIRWKHSQERIASTL